MTNDLDIDEAADLVRLAEHRPTSDDLDAAWSPDRRERVLAGILTAVSSDACVRTGGDGAPRRLGATSGPLRSRRRLVALVGVAAAAAVAISVVPALLSPQSLPAAGAIDRLAQAAGRSHALVIPDGKFLHMVVRETQHGGGESANGTRTHESWTNADGHVWRKDTDNGQISYLSLPSLDGGPVDMSPRGVAALPTDPDALLDHLESRVEGSTSTDEAVFVAVGDMTRMGYTPPAVRAAAIQALGRLPEVSAVESLGQVTLTFTDDSTRPGVRQSLVFDATTTRLVAETLTAPDMTFRSETLTSEVVDGVPAAVTGGAANSPVKQASGSAGPGS
ncbi:hypothetical protein ACWEOW_22960 [Monashia sp. NPDC004114]